MGADINTALQNFQADSLGSDLDLGFIDIYDFQGGSLLVSLALAADAYPSAAAGTALANGVVQGVAVLSGQAGWAIMRNAANSRFIEGSVTIYGGNGVVKLGIVDTGIVLGETITLAASRITQLAS